LGIREKNDSRSGTRKIEYSENIYLAYRAKRLRVIADVDAGGSSSIQGMEALEM